MIDIVIIGVIVVSVAFSAAYARRRKKAGKSSCGYGCEHCSASSCARNDHQI